MQGKPNNKNRRLRNCKFKINLVTPDIWFSEKKQRVFSVDIYNILDFRHCNFENGFILGFIQFVCIEMKVWSEYARKIYKSSFDRQPILFYKKVVVVFHFKTSFFAIFILIKRQNWQKMPFLFCFFSYWWYPSLTWVLICLVFVFITVD